MTKTQFVQTEIKNLLASLNISENDEVKEWVKNVSELSNATPKAKIYAEMGLKSCIIRQKLKIDEAIIEGLITVVLSLVSFGSLLD